MDNKEQPVKTETEEASKSEEGSLSNTRISFRDPDWYWNMHRMSLGVYSDTHWDLQVSGGNVTTDKLRWIWYTPCKVPVGQKI